MIKTGSGMYDEGNLIVKMDGTLVACGYYKFDSDVFFSCVSELQRLTIQNPTSDAWAGQISITVGGVPTAIGCIGCTRYPGGGNIVVENDANSGDLRSGLCIDGQLCEITWAVLGLGLLYVLHKL